MGTENLALTILSGLAFLLLIVVTGGVAYLTTIEWRDRRLQDRERRNKR